jgi:hypothetical protein
MVNQQLLDYIKQQLEQNVSKEQIKGSLLTNGWLASDVEEGFTVVMSPLSAVSPAQAHIIPPNIQPVSSYINPVVSPNVQSSYGFANPVTIKKSKKWLWIGLFLAVIAFAGLGWYAFIYQNQTKATQPAEVPIVNQGANQAVSQTPISQVPATPNPDIERVKVILEDIRQGFLTNNKALIIQHSTAETAQFMSASKQGLVNTFIINSVSLSGSNIIANATSVSSAGSDTQDMVFIKEGGDWKFDISATMQRATNQGNVNNATNGSTPPAVKLPQSNIPLEITQTTLSSSQLTYPFSGVTLKVMLRNNTTQQIKNYNYRFFLDKENYFGQYVGNELANINTNAIYEMESVNEQGAISELVKSCDFFGLSAGQYYLHLKVSTDTTQPLNADTNGPQVTDKLIPFTLTKACLKK